MKSPVIVSPDVSDDRTARDAGCGCAGGSDPDGTAKPLPILLAPVVPRVPLSLPQASPCCGPLQPVVRRHGVPVPLNRVALPRPVAPPVLAPPLSVRERRGVIDHPAAGSMAAQRGLAAAASETLAASLLASPPCAWIDFAALPPSFAVVSPAPGVFPIRPPPDRTFPAIQRSPRYPTRNANMAPRLRPERAIIIRVSSPFLVATTQFGGSSLWPPAAEIPDLVRALRTLAANNSYGRMRLDFEPNGSQLYFDVLLSPKEGYQQNTVRTSEYAFDEGALFGLIAKFPTLYQRLDLSSYDHVILFVPGFHLSATNRAAPSRTIQYVVFQDTWNTAGDMEALAAGVFHEMGHGYSLAHANTLNFDPKLPPGNTRNAEYGDVYDYMGGMTSTRHRFNPACWPTAPLPPSVRPRVVQFARATEIHANPIHKWHHGWLDDTEVVKVSAAGLSTHTLRSIHDPNGRGRPRALEIDLGFEIGPSGNQNPVSLLIYWRGNEPMVSHGVCVALVSRQLLPYSIRLMELVTGPPSCTVGTRQNTYKFFPGWYAALPPGQSFRLPGLFAGGQAWVDVGCKGLAANGEMEVFIQLPNPVFAFQNLPILDVVTTAEAKRVFTDADTISVAIDAAVPDAARTPWHLIDRAEIDFSIGDGQMQRNTLHLAGSQGQTELKFTVRDPSQVLLVPVSAMDAGSLVVPIGWVPQTVQGTVTLGVKVFTTVNTTITASMRFLVHQTG